MTDAIALFAIAILSVLIATLMIPQGAIDFWHRLF
jgi:hypothetical protein